MDKITIIGLGKLGLCNALCFEKAGFHVYGVDIFQDYVDAINNKTLKSSEPLVEEYLGNSKKFYASTNLEEGLKFSDTIFIIVDTPNGGGENFYDHSKLSRLLLNINKYKISNKHLVICCTVMPGYIDNIAKILIRDCENTSINYNPEFIAQGNIIYGFENPDLILIGCETIESGDRIEEICKKACKNSPYTCRMSPTEAEITKISINGFITTKLSYANMIGDACKNMSANPDIVLDAIGKDSRIGRKYFKYGTSFGGPCFPRDTMALGIFLQQQNIPNGMIQAVRDYNRYHIEYQAKELLDLNLELYVFENVSYKNDDLPIIENSAKLEIAKILAHRGKRVLIRGLQNILDLVKMEYGNLFEYELV